MLSYIFEPKLQKILKIFISKLFEIEVRILQRTFNYLLQNSIIIIQLLINNIQIRFILTIIIINSYNMLLSHAIIKITAIFLNL